NVRFTACSRNSGEYFLLPFILNFYLILGKKGVYFYVTRSVLLCLRILTKSSKVSIQIGKISSKTEKM
ncbi:hypothetical protein ACQV5I_11645, partial [Leptospira interrogans]